MKIILDKVTTIKPALLEGNVIEIKDFNWVVNTSFEAPNYVLSFEDNKFLQSSLYKFDFYDYNA